MSRIRTARRVTTAVVSATAVAIVGPAAIPASAVAAGVVTVGHAPASTYVAESTSTTTPTALPRTDVRTIRVR